MWQRTTAFLAVPVFLSKAWESKFLEQEITAILHEATAEDSPLPSSYKKYLCSRDIVEAVWSSDVPLCNACLGASGVRQPRLCVSTQWRAWSSVTEQTFWRCLCSSAICFSIWEGKFPVQETSTILCESKTEDNRVFFIRLVVRSPYIWGMKIEVIYGLGSPLRSDGQE